MDTMVYLLKKEMNNLWGDLADVSAKMKQLLCTPTALIPTRRQLPHPHTLVNVFDKDAPQSAG